MKKIMIIFIAILILAIPSFGENDLSKEEDLVVQPYFTNIYTFHTYFGIDGNGKAMIDSALDGHGGDNSRIRAKLQRYSEGSWTTLKTFETTSTTSNCTLSKSYYVTKGYAYRVLFYGYVYNGKYLLDYTNQTSTLQIY